MDIAVDRLMTLKVKDVMTRKVICVAKNQRLSDAAGLFLEKGISGAPVIDEHGRCVGVLSAIDYVRRAHAAAARGRKSIRPRSAWAGRCRRESAPFNRNRHC